MNNNLIVSTSPHFHGKVTTCGIMRDVIIALLPATAAAVVFYGIKALLMIAVTVAVSVGSEFFFNLICKRQQTVGDLSAIVTGLLLALTLPSTVTLWQCAVGAVFAIVVVKCLFGGIGCNFANPAITARVFLLIAFSSSVAGGTVSHLASPEITSSATPLEVIKSGEGTLPELVDMFIGNRGGAIGETCAIALLVGFAYLLIRRVISWETPVIYVGTVFALSLAINQNLTTALYMTLGGGLLLGAIFMATDYVTTPLTRRGKAIFGLGCGLLTVLIRLGSYPEGVSFAILFMNLLTPFIDKWFTPKPIGGVKREK